MSIEFEIVKANPALTRGKWGSIFAQIEPGMAAVMTLTPSQTKQCRSALSRFKSQGKFQDLYTYTENGKFHVARKIE